ncbi:MAG: lactonase family protein [Pedobacter sp.]|nr:lactonase family protein [Pedobacter sp.]
MKRFTFLAAMLLGTQLHAQTYNLLIGTYTNSGKSEGIYVYNFNDLNGEFKAKSIAKGIENPSFINLSPDQKSLYAVNESGAASTVSALSFDSASGELLFLNKKSSEGKDPCYVTSDATNVIIANYSSGSIAVYGKNLDGSLTNPKQVIQHTGKSIDPGRQASAHAHMVQFTPDKKYLVCTDLGEDLIYIYNYNASGKENILNVKTVLRSTPGTGPRHLTFSSDGKFAYLAHEFNGSITAYSYKNGNLQKIQEISSVEKDFKGRIDAADIHVSADGKFLYESNRGDANTINVFTILPTGRLAFASRISSLGKGPRNFAIAPSGRYLLVANQNSDEIVIFKRDRITGALTDSEKRISVGSPVSLIFAPIQQPKKK